MFIKKEQVRVFMGYFILVYENFTGLVHRKQLRETEPGGCDVDKRSKMWRSKDERARLVRWTPTTPFSPKFLGGWCSSVW